MNQLWAMQVFVRVVECGSFTKAAESLNLANATVTSCVRNLEKHLGVTLLQRNTRFLHLTDEGTLFVQRCLEIIRDVERAESEVQRSQREFGGVIRVESPVAIAHALICRALPDFIARHPKLSVAMILNNSPQNMIERGTDLAIRMDEVDDVEVVARAVYEARYVVCASPDFLARHPLPVSPRELDPALCLGLLGEGRYLCRGWSFSDELGDFEIRPKGPISFNSSEALILAAKRHAGLVYLLDVFVNEHIAAGDLVEVFGEVRTSKRVFYAATPKARYVAPKLDAFIEFLTEIFAAQGRPPRFAPVAVRSARKSRRVS